MFSFLKKIMRRIRGEPDIELLVRNGMAVGVNLHMQDHCRIDISFCWLISIGNNVTLAPNVSIIAHDTSTKRHLGYTKIGLVSIGDNTFVGQDATILPGVRIGRNCIIGAGSVVNRDVPDNSVFAGNPARFLCSTETFVSRNKELMANHPVFDFSWTTQSGVSEEKKHVMIERLQDGIGFIE